MANTSEEIALRGEDIEKMVHVFALQEMKMKQLVMTSTSGAWVNTYFQEVSADITAGATESIKGTPRFANFPFGDVSEERKSSYIEKYALETNISWEDWKTSQIDIMARKAIRVARGVARAVDTQIWNVLTENQSAVNINSLTIAAGKEWNSANVSARDPIQNILDAIALIGEDNYDISTGGYLVVNPTDYAYIMGNANIRNASEWGTSTADGGKIQKICGLTIIVSKVVTADYAGIFKGQEVGTWKQVEALTTKTIEDPGIKLTIRAWEQGVCQLVAPNAACLIVNTRA